MVMRLHKAGTSLRGIATQTGLAGASGATRFPSRRAASDIWPTRSARRSSKSKAWSRPGAGLPSACSSVATGDPDGELFGKTTEIQTATVKSFLALATPFKIPYAIRPAGPAAEVANLAEYRARLRDARDGVGSAA
jgi:hypothetical protein